jgi:hypothetical protein
MFKLVPLALSALFVLGTATAGSHPGWYSHRHNGSWPRKSKCQSAQRLSRPSRSVEMVDMYSPSRRVGVSEMSWAMKKSST